MLSHIPAYFFAGVFLANFVPHFVSGVLGRTFPTPFASPPFRGPSPPPVNVLYAAFNLAVAYALLVHVGNFEPHNLLHAGSFGLGLTAWALLITRSLARIQKRACCPSCGDDDSSGNVGTTGSSAAAGSGNTAGSGGASSAAARARPAAPAQQRAAG